MLLVEHVVGSAAEPALHDRLHDLEHRGAVDEVTLAVVDMARRRLRTVTRDGVEIAIALPREERLFDGAVLVLEADRAVVVRAEPERWLRLVPRGIADAVELGYHAGNLHWRVRFEGEALLVALDGPADAYLARLGDLVVDRRVASAAVELRDAGPDAGGHGYGHADQGRAPGHGHAAHGQPYGQR